MFLYRCVVFALLAKVCLTDESVISDVSIGNTTFLGTVLETWKKSLFFAFRGIRYAEPPIGVLRFRDPKPISYYSTGVYNAQHDRNDCPSIYARQPSEDCLYLNVYTRHIPKNSTSFLPVIVFLHPGGFYIGSGLSTFVGPQYLLEEEIVLVTINYRLGTLGFLNLGTEDIPGNAGLKDQVLALRWVKQYIKHFGGDDENITLMGYSAGAFSVSLHLVSPMSKFLFDKAIIMSGSIPPQVTLHDNQHPLAARQARILGCKNYVKSEDILDCLNLFNGTEIANTLRNLFSFGKDNPIFLWLPVIEKDFGQERFLLEDPYKTLKNGNFNQVPVLSGFSSNELCTSAADIISNLSLLLHFDEQFDCLAPICFHYNAPANSAITASIRQHYFENGTIDERHFKELCNLFSDSLIRFGSHRLNELVSAYSNVLPYKFSYVGQYTHLEYQHGLEKGVEHMDDLMYVFKMQLASFTPLDAESTIVQTMTHLLSSFAKNHGQLFHGFSDGNWNFKDNTYAEITNRLNLKHGRNFDNSQFWDALFPLKMQLEDT